MRTTQHLKDLAISETGFVFDPYTGATFTTNAAGHCILLALREGLPRAAICDRLRERFVIGSQDLDGDLGEFVQLLRQSGVVDEGFQL